MDKFTRLPASLESLRAGTIPPPDEPLTLSELSDINTIPACQLMVSHNLLGEEQIDPTSITNLYKSHISSLLPSLFTGNPSPSPASPLLNLPTEILTSIFTTLPITSLLYLRLLHPRFKAIIDSHQTYRLLTTHCPHLLHLSLITNLGTHPHFILPRFHTLLFGNPSCYNCGLNYLTPTERLHKITLLSHHTTPFYGDDFTIFDLAPTSFPSLKTHRFPLHLRLDFPNLQRTCCAPALNASDFPLTESKQSRLAAQTLLKPSELCEKRQYTGRDLVESGVPFVCYPPGLKQGTGGLDTWLEEWERQMCVGRRIYRMVDLSEAGVVEGGLTGICKRSGCSVADGDGDEEIFAGMEVSVDGSEGEFEDMTACVAQRAERFRITMPLLVLPGGEEVVKPVACKGCLFFDFVARSVDCTTPQFPPRSLVRPEWEVREHVRECACIVELVRTAKRALRRRNGEIGDEDEVPVDERGMVDYEFGWGSYQAGDDEMLTDREWDGRRNRQVERSAEVILGWLKEIEEDGMSMDDFERIVKTMRLLDWAEKAEKGILEEGDEGVFIRDFEKEEAIQRGGFAYDMEGVEDEQFSWLYGGDELEGNVPMSDDE